METTTLEIQVENRVKEEAAAIYENLGIDLQTAVCIFLKRSIRENGLPFRMNLTEPGKTSDSILKIIHEMSEEARMAGISDMSLDEINAEIAAVRAERRARKVAQVEAAQ